MSQAHVKPKIGIVSGVGPLAGSDVLAKVLKQAATHHKAVEDSEYPDLLLVNHGIAGVDNTGTLSDVFEKDITSMVEQLEQQGATVIGIACNTAHTYLGNIKAKTTVKLVDLIDEVAATTAKSSARYLLLTSGATKQQQLYHSYLAKYAVSFEETTGAQQALLDEIIGLIMAHKLDAAGKLMEHVLQLAQAAGFSAVIAGCTELPIAVAHCDNISELQIVDSNEVLARSLAGHYYAQLRSEVAILEKYEG